MLQSNQMLRLAVVTRTKNRALLLKRCADGLARQKYKNFVWSVVNDAGDVDSVNSIVDYAKNQLGLNVVCTHLSESFGIGNAANQGIINSDSDLIHLHDDDDTICEDYYLSVVERFNSISSNFVGVVVDTRSVVESVSGGEIKFLKSYSSHKSIDAIHIADIFQKNRFPPISLIYKRSAALSIGMYDVNLPVLEDWDFNIRLLMHGDFAFISEELANYHIRVGADGMQGQTITSNDGRHDLYSALVRNKYFRHAGDLSLIAAMAVTVGRASQKIDSNVVEVLHFQKSSWTIKRLLKKILGSN